MRELRPARALPPMRRIQGLGGCLAICLLASGCVVAQGTITVGRALDPAKVADLKPGITTMSEILQWFGPPDYVIDGRQVMLDEAGFLAETPMDFKASRQPPRVVPVRPVRAPEGTLIFVYSTVQARSGRTTAASGLLAQESTSARPGEVFIFLSKDTRKVADVAIGRPAKD